MTSVKSPLRRTRDVRRRDESLAECFSQIRVNTAVSERINTVNAKFDWDAPISENRRRRPCTLIAL